MGFALLSKTVKILLKYSLKWLLWLCLTVFILLALYLSLMRYYLPQLNEYKTDIQKTISYFTQQEISIGHLHGKLNGLRPVVSADDLRLYSKDKQREFISVGSLTITPNIVESARNRKFYLGKLNLNAVEISLHEDEKKWEFFQEFLDKYSNKNAKPKELLRNIAAFDSIDAQSISVNLYYKNEEVIHSPFLDMQLERANDFRRITINANSEKAATSNKVLDFILESQGNLDTDKLDAHWELKANDFDLSFLSSLLINYNMRVNSQAKAINLTGHLSSDQKIALKGDVDIKDTQVRESGQATWGVNNLTSQFSFDAFKINDLLQQNLYLKDLKLNQAGSLQSTLEAANIRLTENSHARQITLLADKAHVKPTARFLNQLPWMPVALNKWIANLNAQGQLEGAQLFVQQLKEQGQNVYAAPRWEFSSDLSDVKSDAYQGAPSVAGLDGWVWLNEGSGVLKIKPSKRVSIHFEKTFQKPFILNALKGDLIWKRNADKSRTYINSQALTANYQGAKIGAWFALGLDHQDKSASTLSLNVGSKGALPVSLHSVLIPQNVSPSLKQWLSKSVKDGSVNNAAFLLHGKLGVDKSVRTLDDVTSNTLQLALDVNKAKVKYHEKWPEIVAGDAKIWMSQRDVEIKVGKSSLLNSKVENAQVNITPIKKFANLGSEIKVTGDLNGGVADIISTLRSSEISKSLSAEMADWEVSGLTKTQLDLGVVIRGSENPQIKVKASSDLQGVDLTLKKQGLSFSKLKGVLNYDSEKGLYSSQNIQGLFKNHVASAKLTQKKCASNGAGLCTVIDVNGEVAPEMLSEWVDPAIVEQLDGKTNYQANIVLGEADKTTIKVKSSLVGMTSNLPIPLKKESTSSLPLEFTQIFKGEENSQRIEFKNIFTLFSAKRAKRNRKTFINFGPLYQPLRSIANPGIAIQGSLAEADLNQWQTLISAYGKESDAETSEVPAVAVNQLKVGKLIYKDYQLENAVVDLVAENQGLYIVDVDSDALKGQVKYNTNAEIPTDLKLNYVNISKLFGENKTVEEVKASVAKSVPEVNAVIDKVIFNEQEYGSWAFTFIKSDENDDFVVEKIKGGFDGVVVNSIDKTGAIYKWRASPGSAKGISSFKGQIISSDLERQLKRANIDSLLRAKKSMLNTDVTWVGGAADFAMAKTQGRWALELNDGSFLRTPAAATGASKVLGLINIADILRHLKLDFSDLAEEGLTFRRLYGRFNSAASVFETVDSITIEGASSKIKIDGYVNSYTNKADLDLVITIPIRSNLPWVVGFIGGLPAAAGVFLASKLMKKTVDQLSSLVYNVSGDITNPDVKFKRLFNFKLPKTQKQKEQEEAERRQKVNEIVEDSVVAESVSIESESSNTLTVNQSVTITAAKAVSDTVTSPESFSTSTSLNAHESTSVIKPTPLTLSIKETDSTLEKGINKNNSSDGAIKVDVAVKENDEYKIKALDTDELKEKFLIDKQKQKAEEYKIKPLVLSQ